jgi:hypothetical protein
MDEGTSAEEIGQADYERRSERCGGSGVLDPTKGDGNEWCLPNAISVVSSHLGLLEDFVSSSRNGFYFLCSLSTLISLPHQ